MTGFVTSDEQDALAHSVRRLLETRSPLQRVRDLEPLGFDGDLHEEFSRSGLYDIRSFEASDGVRGKLADCLVVAVECGRALAPIPYADVVTGRQLTSQLGGTVSSRDDGLTTFAPISSQRKGDAVLVANGAVKSHAFVLLDGHLCRIAPASRRQAANLGHLPFSWVNQSEFVSVPEIAPEAQRALSDTWMVLFSGQLVGLARRALELAILYASTRKQFDSLIGSFQGVAHPMADGLTEIEGTELLVSEAAWAVDSSDPSARWLPMAALSRSIRLAERVTGISLHVHGGYGFTTEYDIQLYYRRGKGWPAAYVEPAALHSFLVAEFLAEPGQRLGGADR